MLQIQREFEQFRQTQTKISNELEDQLQEFKLQAQKVLYKQDGLRCSARNWMPNWLNQKRSIMRWKANAIPMQVTMTTKSS